jgi:hypothetical protein
MAVRCDKNWWENLACKEHSLVCSWFGFSSIYLRKTFNIALCVGCKFKIISILENIEVHIAAINQIIKDENEK